MKEYIEKEKAIEAAWHNYYPSIDHYTVSVKCATRKDIEEIPAADVREVVRGEWIEKDLEPIFPGMDEHPILGCSKCDFQIYDLGTVRERYNYCPHCGAYMRGENDEN